MRVVALSVVVLLLSSLSAVACSSGGDEPSEPITRIDGPAVVDEDEARANNGATDDGSDG